MSQTKVEAPFVEGGGGAPFRNKVINGDFQVHQRFDGTAVTASTGYQSFDRWKTVAVNTSAGWTIEKETLSAADLATTGHKQAMEIKCTTADTSTGSNEYNAMYHAIEANSLQDLNYGTSAAKSFTVSFWVRSYQTGTFVLAVTKEDGTTYYNRIEYTINASNTWEHKTLVFSPTAGDTSLITGANGYINNDTGLGMALYFMLNAGSNYHGTNNTWTTGSIATSNQTNLMSSTDNHWSITGLQMEVGDQKTDFEYLPHDIQLNRCKRYYQLITKTNGDTLGQGTHYSAATVYMSEGIHPEMRTVPSLSVTGGTNYFIRYSNSGNDTFDNFGLDSSSGPTYLEFYAGNSQNHDGGTAGHACFIRTNNASAVFAISSEF